MNNYGLILNDIGMEHSLTSLLHSFLKPVAALLYPDDGGRTVDHHHSFLVQYKPDADRLLDMHVDDSEVTFNVNVLDAFEGSALTFCGRLQSPDHRQRQLGYKHELVRVRRGFVPLSFVLRGCFKTFFVPNVLCASTRVGVVCRRAGSCRCSRRSPSPRTSRAAVVVVV
jgi:hypothetical protein